jgi:hypothetical protein
MTISPPPTENAEVQPVSWNEFRDAGLLWWVNRQLHLFGYAITVLINEDGSVAGAEPARCSYRGFSEESETRGFERLATHMRSMSHD